MSITSLLNDAAAYATTDLRLDLAAVRQRAELEQRRRTRRVRQRAGLVAALAVAATVALIAVLLPAGSSVHGLVLPADAPAPLPSVTGGSRRAGSTPRPGRRRSPGIR